MRDSIKSDLDNSGHEFCQKKTSKLVVKKSVCKSCVRDRGCISELFYL